MKVNQQNDDCFSKDERSKVEVSAFSWFRVISYLTPIPKGISVKRHNTSSYSHKALVRLDVERNKFRNLITFTLYRNSH